MNKLLVFAKKNKILTISITFIVFAVLSSAIKMVKPNTKPIYVKIKVSQGLWWVQGKRPGIWYVDSINKQDVKLDTSKNTSASIQKITYYPYPSADIESQYDVYVEAKIHANFTNGQYNFKRLPVSVGSPINLDLLSTQVVGTIIAISETPFQDNYEEKIVYIQKKGSFPSEYDLIEIGDYYFDGENNVFEVLDKDYQHTRSMTGDVYGNYLSDQIYNTEFITVKTKMLLKKTPLGYLYGEEMIVSPGDGLYIQTPNQTFSNYFVSKIEDVE